MNRAERRRLKKGKPQPDPQPRTPEPAKELVWKSIFDAKPMAEGMPPHFLLYLLNEKEGLPGSANLLPLRSGCRAKLPL